MVKGLLSYPVAGGPPVAPTPCSSIGQGSCLHMQKEGFRNALKGSDHQNGCPPR